MAVKTESNSYTVIFAIIMVVIVGALLAGISSALSSQISENKKLEKKQNILYAMGVNKNEGELGGGKVAFLSTTEANNEFSNYVKAQYLINPSDNSAKEVKGAEDLINFNGHREGLPLYVGEKDGNTLYIIPVNGRGLWDAIWGYIAVDKDLIVRGVFFDHKGETAGLGANIKERFFMDDFMGEHLLDAAGNFQSIKVAKGNGDPENKHKEDGKIDAIAGATLTGNGVQAMISDGIEPYISYIKSLNK
nr:Na(+)-translocating NADH-quinone reductase subunit C [uncultured Capnocytophaga sp.]